MKKEDFPSISTFQEKHPFSASVYKRQPIFKAMAFPSTEESFQANILA
jgi:hypothetical protein